MLISKKTIRLFFLLLLLILATVSEKTYAKFDICVVRTDSLPIVANAIKICANSTITLVAKACNATNATEIYITQWINLDDPSITVINPKFLMQEAGRYEVSITAKSTNEIVYATITVSYVPKEAFKINPTSPVKCKNDKLVMKAITSGFKDYKWRLLIGTSIISYTDSLINPAANKEYVVSAISPNGCKVDSNIFIVQAPNVFEPKINLGPRDTSLCDGKVLRLKNLLGNMYTHIWSNNSKDSFNIVTQPGTYWLKIKTALCSATDTIIVKISPTPKFITNTPFYACYGSGITLRLEVQGDSTAYRYQWSPSASLNFNNIKSPIARPTVNTIYKVRATGNGGCFDTTSVKVFINPKLVVKVSSKDTLLCGGDSLKLNSSASGGIPLPDPIKKYNFQWLPNENITNANTAAPTVTPNQTTYYKLKVNDANGCSDTAGTLVKVYRLKVEIPALPKSDFCLFDSIPLRAKITANSQTYTLKWRTTSPRLVDSTLNETYYIPTELGQHSILAIAKDPSGCEVRTVVKLTIHPHPKVLTTEKYRRICFGDSTKILATANGGSGIDYKFSWFPLNSGIANVANSTATFVGKQEVVGKQKYRVIVRDSYGCRSKPDSVIIETIPFYVANLGAADTSVCVGKSVKLFPLSPIPPTFTYNWVNATTGTTIGKDSFIVVNTTGLYQLKVEDAQSGCSNKVSKQVNILLAPKPVKIVVVSEICATDTLKLIATPITEKANVKWTTTGAGILANTTNDSSFYLAKKGESGLVKFTATLTNDCGSSDTIGSVAILASPILSLVATPNETLIDSTINFANTSNFAGDLFWNFNDGSPLAQGKETSHIFTTAKKHTITVYSKPVAGTCPARDSISVTVTEGKIITELFIPNVFAPTSTDLDNQALKVFGKNISNTNFVFRVYSRWGELIFETNNFEDANTKGWNGTNNIGQSLDVGSYTFVVSGEFRDGKQFENKGNVTLLR